MDWPVASYSAILLQTAFKEVMGRQAGYIANIVCTMWGILRRERLDFRKAQISVNQDQANLFIWIELGHG